jgi:hypothetical protein
VGPLEEASFPETLSARVVTPGQRPRIHGYDVEGDLALHYDPTEVLFLSLTGDLPTREAGAALRVALTFFGPVSVAHASVHAAALARLCGTTSGSILGVAAIGLAEQARVLLEEHAELLAWLHTRDGDLPRRYRTSDDSERARRDRLRAALACTGFEVPELALDVTADAGLFIVLVACGLRRREQIEAALVTARLPSTVAEAIAEKVVNFSHYPTNLPVYRYEES